MGKSVVSHSYNSEKGIVNVTVQDKDGSEDHLTADLFVCAEGASSSSREIYFPGLPRTYAGYLAFRGLWVCCTPLLIIYQLQRSI